MRNIKKTISAFLTATFSVSSLLVAQNMDNEAPVAAITGDVSVIAPSSPVSFDGSSSFDPNNDTIIGYQWEADRPDNSDALLDITGAEAILTPDRCGTYVVSLTVTDAGGASNTTSREISCENAAPVIGTIAEQNVYQNQLVTCDLDATDPNNDALTFAWTLTAPDGSLEQTTSDSGSFSFTATTLGSYTVKVSVSDSKSTPVVTSTTVHVTRSASGTVAYLMYVSEIAAKQGSAAFQNRKMPNAFGKKISAVISNINDSLYTDALDLLTDGIIAKTDGFVRNAAVDANDWITSEDAQKAIYPVLLQTKEGIEALLSQ